MATFEIKMPKLGESITEGTIVSWAVQKGDEIKEDSVLFEVSTAKVSAEIPSPVAGKVLEILFQVGETVPVGTTVALIRLEGSEEEGDGSGTEQPASEVKAAEPEKAPEKAAAGTADTALPKARAATEEQRWYSPIVLQVAQQANISKEEMDAIPGTGYMGRLSKSDIEEYIRNKQTHNAGVKAPVQEVKPAAIQQPAVSRPQASFGGADMHSAPAAPVQASAPGQDEVVEMDRVRRIIADHMVLSKKVSPHVTSVVEVDVTKLVKWRSKVKDAFMKREGIALTFMPAITEAVAKALADYPMVNSSVEGYNIILRKHINVGIAVSLNDGNLIVPVVKDADKLNINGLAAAIDSLAVKARDNKLSPDDIQGGTFTITNFGTFKTLFGMPIINQPQVAILGVGYIEKKPAVVETPEGDTIAIRHKMYLSLSYDHRIVDGALGGMFLKRVADYLENWDM